MLYLLMKDYMQDKWGQEEIPVASSLVKDADVILALGTRLGFNSTFYSYDNINKEAKIIQVDIDKISLGRYFPITLGICNDVKD